MKQFLQFGAGSIGRSLVGTIFADAGYEMVFADADRKLVDAINERKEYSVRIVEDEAEDDSTTVSGIRAVHVGDQDAIDRELGRTDLVGTAVGSRAFSSVCALIAKGLANRKRPVSVILCENINGAAGIAGKIMRENLPRDFPFGEMIGLVETSIGKMVPMMSGNGGGNPLEVRAESYNKIIADADGFIGDPPAVEGLVIRHNFTAYVKQKLFIHNLGHAVAAYHGFLCGKSLIWEVLRNPIVLAEAKGAMHASAAGLVKLFPSEFNAQNQKEHVDDLIRRFANRRLGDSVYRVGRDLSRKLAPGDRFIGALRLAEQTGGDASHVCRGIAAALLFKATDENGRIFPPDAEFNAYVREKGVKAALKHYCGLDPEVDTNWIEMINLFLFHLTR